MNQSGSESRAALSAEGCACAQGHIEKTGGTIAACPEEVPSAPRRQSALLLRAQIGKRNAVLRSMRQLQSEDLFEALLEALFEALFLQLWAFCALFCALF